jgi:16S rRNA (uracil1498-N3)-methyltransferase
MRNRFYYPAAMRSGDSVELGGEEFHHAVRVHRSRAGEEVELFDGRGKGFVGRIDTIGKTSARIEILDPAPSRELTLELTLCLALIQPDKFELVLQKGTELGVHRFVPLITDRAEVRPERLNPKRERWEKLVLEAAKQSGRASLPALDGPQTFASAVHRDSLRIVFDAEAEPTPLPPTVESLSLFIGPEGGWSDEELALASEAGCAFRRLGPRRLRAETAAIAAVTMAATRFGDLS